MNIKSQMRIIKKTKKRIYKRIKKRIYTAINELKKHFKMQYISWLKL